jgi:hypothetical protein
MIATPSAHTFGRHSLYQPADPEGKARRRQSRWEDSRFGSGACGRQACPGPAAVKLCTKRRKGERLKQDSLELCCLDCGYTETVVAAPEWLRGERYHCPRCGTESWALAPAELTTCESDLERAEDEDESDGRPRIIYRSSSPLHPDC